MKNSNLKLQTGLPNIIGDVMVSIIDGLYKLNVVHRVKKIYESFDKKFTFTSKDRFLCLLFGGDC